MLPLSGTCGIVREGILRARQTHIRSYKSHCSLFMFSNLLEDIRAYKGGGKSENVLPKGDAHNPMITSSNRI